MPRFPSLLERFYQPLYDTVEVIPETKSATFFQTAVENGKSIAETNMDKAGHLVYPNNFEICGVSVKPTPLANIDQVKKFAEGAWFRLFIGTKDYLVVPLSLVLDLPEEPMAAVEHASSSDTELLKLLVQKRSNQPIFQLPKDAVIDLIPNLNFRAEIHRDNVAQPAISEKFSLMTVIYGYYKRAVH